MRRFALAPHALCCWSAASPRLNPISQLRHRRQGSLSRLRSAVRPRSTRLLAEEQVPRVEVASLEIDHLVQAVTRPLGVALGPEISLDFVAGSALCHARRQAAPGGPADGARSPPQSSCNDPQEGSGRQTSADEAAHRRCLFLSAQCRRPVYVRSSALEGTTRLGAIGNAIAADG